MTFWRAISRLARPRASASPCGCPEGLPDADAKFSAAITALGAKLAKADGVADADEFAAFSEVFQPEAAAARDVRRLYDLARQTTRGFESYARQIARRYRRCPGVLEDVVDGLFHIAAADGAVSSEELDFIQRVADLFGLSPLTLRRLRNDWLGAPADDPYVLLGVAPDAADEEVRRAWRRLAAAHHPDRAAALGLTPSQIEAEGRRAAAINAAYDRVVRERHDLVGAAQA